MYMKSAKLSIYSHFYIKLSFVPHFKTLKVKSTKALDYINLDKEQKDYPSSSLTLFCPI